jgi:hypothetical protein
MLHKITKIFRIADDLYNEYTPETKKRKRRSSRLAVSTFNRFKQKEKVS